MKTMISSQMDLRTLWDLMDGYNEFDVITATRMRDALVEAAPDYGWESVEDVEDGDWFRMLDGAAA